MCSFCLPSVSIICHLCLSFHLSINLLSIYLSFIICLSIICICLSSSLFIYLPASHLFIICLSAIGIYLSSHLSTYYMSYVVWIAVYLGMHLIGLGYFLCSWLQVKVSFSDVTPNKMNPRQRAQFNSVQRAQLSSCWLSLIWRLTGRCFSEYDQNHLHQGHLEDLGCKSAHLHIFWIQVWSGRFYIVSTYFGWSSCIIGLRSSRLDRRY